MAKSAWDTLIRNALVFDGRGAEPCEMDIAIEGGRIAACGSNLPIGEAVHIIEAKGQWLMPGLLDIHTHLDLKPQPPAGGRQTWDDHGAGGQLQSGHLLWPPAKRRSEPYC